MPPTGLATCIPVGGALTGYDKVEGGIWLDADTGFKAQLYENRNEPGHYLLN